MNFDLSAEDQQHVLNILQDRILPAIKNATIFSEKIPFITTVGSINQTGVNAAVMSRQEAERRRAAVQHETK